MFAIDADLFESTIAPGQLALQRGSGRDVSLTGVAVHGFSCNDEAGQLLQQLTV